MADLQLGIGAGALPVHFRFSWGFPDGFLFSAGLGVPRGPSIQQRSALGPAVAQILCSAVGSGSVSEEVVTAAGLLPYWVPHRPQEGRL